MEKTRSQVLKYGPRKLDYYDVYFTPCHLNGAEEPTKTSSVLHLSFDQSKRAFYLSESHQIQIISEPIGIHAKRMHGDAAGTHLESAGNSLGVSQHWFCWRLCLVV